MNVMAKTGRSTGVLALVGFLVMTEFCSGFLQTWFGPLLSKIAVMHDVAPAQLNWLTSVHLLATVLCVPLIAKLGDLYGHKRMLVITGAVVTAGSLLVAFAPNFGWMLVGRSLEAPIAAFLPLEFAIIRERAGKRSGRAIGFLVGALTLGASVGLLLSGILGQFLPLTIVLVVPGILVGLTTIVIFFAVPETTTRRAGGVDWAGAALLGIGMLALLVGIGRANAWGWLSVQTLGAVAIGVVLLAVWVAVELRVKNPLVDLRMIGRARITVPLVLALMYGAQMFGAKTPIALFVQTSASETGFGLGLGSLATSLVLLVLGLATFIGSTAGDRLAGRLGHRATLFLGGALGAAAFIGLAVAHDSIPVFCLWLFLSGFGNGLVISVLPTVVVLRAPADSVGISSALYNVSRTAAGALSSAVFTFVMTLFVTTVGTGDGAQTASSEEAYVVVWLICAGLAAALALVALTVGKVDRPGNDVAVPEARDAADTPAHAS